jgi:hypothetical protein
MSELPIPERVEDLTPAWLTEALRAGGAISEARVTDAGFQVLGEGAGFIGQLLRVTPTYDRAEPGAPATFIAKMPALDPGARELAAMYGLYELEFRFYTELAPEVTFRTPRCYYAAGDAQAVKYVLLLEDLGATGTPGDQVAGCTPEQARLALIHLAVHHARWWSSPRLTAFPWLGSGIDLVNGVLEQSYPSVWQFTLDHYGEGIPEEIRAVLPTLASRISTLMEPFKQGALTISHGDYRLDNMFFGDPGAGYELAVLDWQSPTQAWPAYDIAYFVYSNIDVETRRAYETELLRGYHSALIAAGVADYDWETLMHDYRASLLVSLAIWVVNVGSLDAANERGAALFQLFFDRLCAAIMDHNALELLPA